jgi:hypothetical protein
MKKAEYEVVRKWQRSCVLLNDCQKCTNSGICEKLAQGVALAPHLWEVWEERASIDRILFDE